MISLIVAMSKNRVIGKNGTLPWSLPAELQHFRNTTKGHQVIVGRRTFEAIGKNAFRYNLIIVSSNPFLKNDNGFPVANNLFDAVNIARAKADSTEIFVAGGKRLFEEALPFIADRIYLTIIDAEIEGDTFFPDFDESLWTVIYTENHKSDDLHVYGWTIFILDRKR